MQARVQVDDERSGQAAPVVRAAHAAVALAIGIAGAARIDLGAAAWLGLAAGAAVWATRTRAARRAGPRWLLAIALVGAGLAAREAAHARAIAAPAGAGIDDRDDDEVEGLIVGPIERAAGGDRIVIEADGGGARIGAWVAAGRFEPGQRVRGRGKLRRPRGYRNPGGIDRAQAARDRGVELELSSPAVTLVEDGASAWAWPVRAQRWASAAVAARGGDPVGNAIVRGAVLGDRSAIEPATDAAWRAAGVYHVLSVSGLHLAVVALLAFACLRRALVLALPSRAAQAIAAAIAAVIAIAYTAMTGAQVATERALVVALVLLGGVAIGRRARLLDALGAAALAILCARPSALADPSFQLSFAAALTLALVAGARRGPPPRGWIARGLGWIGRGVTASAAVTAVTAPISAAHFHQVAIGGVIGNLIVTPLVELIAIPMALGGVAIAALWHGLGGVLIDGAIAITAGADAIARGLAALLPSSPAPPLPALALAAWLGAIVTLVASARGAIARGRAALIALALAALVGWQVGAARGPGPGLRVTFLDVGQGDAAVIEAPGGEVWLVDAGGVPFDADPARADVGPGDAIARFLTARGIDHVDVAIVSHPHPDHYLGLLGLAGRVPIGELWSADAVAPAPPPDPRAAMPSFADATRRLVGLGTRVVHPPLGVARRAGGVTLRVLAPVTDLGDGPRAIATADPVRTVNDDSLVIAIEYAGRRVLFAGDLEGEGEADLIARAGDDVRADVVKVPHHGSPTSSTPALVAATRPGWAVISCGVANRFGFPSPAVVARWTGAGAVVRRTDQEGAVTVRVDPDGAVDVDGYDR